MEEQYSKIPFTCAKCGSKLVAILRVHLDSMAAGNPSCQCPKCGTVKDGFNNEVARVEMA